MPNYRMQCIKCYGEFEIWNSIHEPLPKWHEVHLDPMYPVPCHGALRQVFTQVRTYGVGEHGKETRTVDARERQLDLDRPAYKALRAEGHQPPQMMGSHALTQHATDDWYIKTGGQVSVPEHRRNEINEMLAEGAASDWNPIETVHERRKQAKA